MTRQQGGCSRGFTLIEIVMVLILIALLAAVALPKYFDLRDQAQLRAYAGTVAEAQARINARFAQLLIEGSLCSLAQEQVSVLGNVADTAGGNDFGGHQLELVGGVIKAGGTLVRAKTPESTEFVDTGLRLHTPGCGLSVLDSYLQDVVQSAIGELITNGKDSVGLDWFIQKYLQPVTTENGTTIQLSSDSGELVGIKGKYAKLALIYTDALGNSARIQFTVNADGTTVIHQLKYTEAGKGTSTLVHSSYHSKLSSEKLAAYESSMKNMGIDTSYFNAAFNAPQNGEILIDKNGQASWK